MMTQEQSEEDPISNQSVELYPRARDKKIQLAITQNLITFHQNRLKTNSKQEKSCFPGNLKSKNDCAIPQPLTSSFFSFLFLSPPAAQKKWIEKGQIEKGLIQDSIFLITESQEKQLEAEKIVNNTAAFGGMRFTCSW